MAYANAINPSETQPQVACPHCDSLVRVPAERMRDHPKCPKCHGALFEGHPIALTDANFDKHVGQSSLPVIVDFWAQWCGPCHAMAPVFEQAAVSMEPAVRFAKLDTDAAPQVSARYGIRSIPTLIAFKHGREIARRSGALNGTQLRQWLDAVVAGA